MCGTDGLLNFAELEAIADVARRADLASMPSEPFRLVQLPSGGYPDDVGISVARIGAATPRGLRRRES